MAVSIHTNRRAVEYRPGALFFKVVLFAVLIDKRESIDVSGRGVLVNIGVDNLSGRDLFFGHDLRQILVGTLKTPDTVRGTAQILKVVGHGLEVRQIRAPDVDGVFGVAAVGGMIECSGHLVSVHDIQAEGLIHRTVGILRCAACAVVDLAVGGIAEIQTVSLVLAHVLYGV